MKTISIPGNLLLTGEYAVLEEGGMGITLAVAPRVTVTMEAGPELVIRGKCGTKSSVFTENGVCEGDVRFFADILDQCRKWLAWKKIKLPVAPQTIAIDTPPVSGYGSSAAATIGLVSALLSGHAITGDELFRLAVIAHRHSQGGFGSGYDIAASFYGGTGLFQGGEHPLFKPVVLKYLPPLYLIRNQAPIITKQSIKQYNKWKAAQPSHETDFVIQSNRHVHDLLDAESLEETLEILDRSKRHSSWLGEEIGVPAYWEDMDELLNAHCLFYKSVGAGNEFGICVFNEPAVPPELVCLQPEPVVLSDIGIIYS